MPVETLGDALDLSWRVHMRCAHGPRDGMKRRRECVYGRALDLETLVCTRGRAFPLARLAERLRCPRCGSREIAVLFDPPAGAGYARVG
jgi:hypothetical protein